MDTIVITGASDGIGAASARQLRRKGHHVVLVGRSRSKTEAIARELDAPFHVVDFSSLRQVRQLAQELSGYERIVALANNAGGIMGERKLTEDGFESTFQLNHLAPFLLTSLLLPKLRADGAKVVQTASFAANHFGSRFSLDDLNNERDYNPLSAYGHGKLANILFTRELQRRHGEGGISAVAFHPGVVRSNFAHDTTHPMRFLYHTILKYLVTISVDSSGRRLTSLIEGTPGVNWIPGQVYNKTRLMPVRFQDPDGSAARKLWDLSEAMVAPFLAPL